MPSAAASRPWILEKSKPSKVLGSRLGSLLSLSSVSMEASLLWIGYTDVDDSGRDSPASLNSTGDM